jgi:hypothetical protein
MQRVRASSNFAFKLRKGHGSRILPFPVGNICQDNSWLTKGAEGISLVRNLEPTGAYELLTTAISGRKQRALSL